MDDKEYRKQKARIKKYMDKWHSTLGLRWFDVDIIYDRSISNDGSAAITDMGRWSYRSFDITFYMPIMAELNDERFEEVVVHELVHCLTAPFAMNMQGSEENSNYRRDIMEQTTTIITNAIEWSYQAGIDSVKVNKETKEKKV